MSRYIQRISALGIGLFPKKRYASVCGHYTKQRGVLVAPSGERRATRLLPEADGTVGYCLDCLSQMIIICAWCGKPIYPGDKVKLYRPSVPTMKTKEGSVLFSENPKKWIVCSGSACVMGGEDAAGVWIPNSPGADKGAHLEIYSHLHSYLHRLAHFFDPEQGGLVGNAIPYEPRYLRYR